MKHTSHSQLQNNRPTIGMLTSWLVELHQLQWLGAVDAARAHGANLICFVGKELDRPDNFYAQANVVYELVDPEQLDGLIIWTATLQSFTSPQRLEAFCQRYRPLPMISVEQRIAGIPGLVVDDRGGMREAVGHLIEVHGYRRIAFIRGPENHPGAEERYQGYLEALAQYGLPFDPQFVPPPPAYWLRAEAMAMTNRLLEEQATKVEAIVAANDNLALGVLLTLQAHRIQTPGDIAVIGFDNWMNVERSDLGADNLNRDPASADRAQAANLRVAMLPLTTVQSPFYETGWRSVEMMLAQLQGERPPEVATLPTELIVRRSCGCFSTAVRGPALEPPLLDTLDRSRKTSFAENIEVHWATIITGMKEALRLPSTALAPDWADQLLVAFIKELGDLTSEAFLVKLDELVRASLRQGDDLDHWWQVLFALRRQLFPYLVSANLQAQAERLWQRVQPFMGEMAKQFTLYQQLRVEKSSQILREIGQKLITSLDIEQLAQVLAQELPTLGLKSCYLALYETHPFGLDGGQGTYPTVWSRSILVYEQEPRLALIAGATLFPSRQLVPGERLHRQQPYSLVVKPLYFKEQQLGFVLFELGPREGGVYDSLRRQLSSALQAALLVEREKQALAAVEEAKRRVEAALIERARLLEESQEKNRLLQQEILQRQQVELALQKVHAELEGRVTERTAELAQANQILKEQMAEQQRAEEIRAELEAQLRQAQKMEAIGRLAGGIAHDFNNLLVVIIGYSELLLGHLEAGELPDRRDIEQIRKAGERAATLTRQLLAFSRQQVLQPKVLNLNTVVTNVETMLRRLIGEDIKLITRLDPLLAPITADPGQIEQIIINLAVNARDAMPQGGELTLETSNIHLDTAQARQQVGDKTGLHVMLRVTDTGTGMDAETQDRLFEPFFTTKPPGEGTGLGLATVFGIVQQSGGYIDVFSQPGQGTTFKLYLPRHEQTLNVAQISKGVMEAALIGSETILLVEDDPDVREITRHFLEEYGYTVLEAHHGAEALRLCQEYEGPIHLLITDVVMPGMSGRELVEHLMPHRPELSILYVSGYTDSTVLRHGISEATIRLLQKPFTAETLAIKVREILDLRLSPR